MNQTASTRSMFGVQPLSHRRSGPAFGMGSSTRDTRAKVFISQQHSKSTAGASPGPGAGYALNGSVGRQALSRRKSAPSSVFGTANRFTHETRASSPGPGAYGARGSFGTQASRRSEPSVGFGSAGRAHFSKVYVSEEHQKSLHGINSPGPLSYKLKSTVGKQEDSRKASPPAWAFGGEGRFRYDYVRRAALQPGPGAYNLLQSVGRQVASTSPSAPEAGFGTSDRHTQNKLYLSPEHEKMHFGKQSPGPSSYTLPSSVAKQHLSRNASMPSWGFGTASRWPSSKPKPRGADTPGPGTYSI